MGSLIRLKSLVPDYYQGIYDMDILVAAEQPVLDEFNQLIEKNRDNHFAVLADAEGLSIFENMLGITDVLGKDLDTRRYEVIVQLLPPKPVTISYLREILDALNIDAELIVQSDKFHVDVKARTEDNSAMARLKALLNRFLPANMTFTTFNFNKVSTTGETTVGTSHVTSTTISNKGG